MSQVCGSHESHFPGQGLAQLPLSPLPSATRGTHSLWKTLDGIWNQLVTLVCPLHHTSEHFQTSSEQLCAPCRKPQKAKPAEPLLGGQCALHHFHVCSHHPAGAQEKGHGACQEEKGFLCQQPSHSANTATCWPCTLELLPREAAPSPSSAAGTRANPTANPAARCTPWSCLEEAVLFSGQL